MSNGVAISLRNVSFAVPKRFLTSGVNLLSDITLDVRSGQFFSILGPSGAGKSTLLHLMNGDFLPTAGEIQFDGLPPHAYLPERRQSLAYLPQAPVLHDPLTPRRALSYSARLRGLELDREQLISVLEQVELSHRANTPIRKLSGGERKRVALAAELLGDPVALFLDEATSGLDPATEKEMMELFLRESRSGKTVICITHFPDNVSLCDGVIVLARGRLIFFGTPAELLTHFKINIISELYPKLTGDLSIIQQARLGVETDENEMSVGSASASTLLAKVPGPIAQIAILAARYIRLLALDPRNIALLLLQAPVIALFIGATFGNIAVDYSEQHAADLKQVAFLLIMAVLWCAGTNGVREIVKERPIFLHESRYGLNEASYFISKFLPLGLLGVIQAMLLLVLLGRITHLVGDWSTHFAVLSLLALAATAIGLCISAAVTTSERAMTFLPVVLIGLAVLSGGLARLQGWIKLAAYLFDPAFWTLEGLKSTLPSNLTEASFISAPGMYQPVILGRGLPLWLDISVLGLQIVALLWLGVMCLVRTQDRTFAKA
jgi:ABC-type multidrug transport system ATPase subunit